MLAAAQCHSFRKAGEKRRVVHNGSAGLLIKDKRDRFLALVRVFSARKLISVFIGQLQDALSRSAADSRFVVDRDRNGGRGTWINQPRNLILSDNIFVRNTGKCAKIPGRGRRGWKDADYESYPEIYFSRYEKDGRYGSIIMRGNIFESDDYASCAVKFSPGGDEILVESNIFKGKAKNIIFEGCSNLRIRDNIGASVKNE